MGGVWACAGAVKTLHSRLGLGVRVEGMGKRAGAAGAARAVVGGFGHALEPLKHYISRLGMGVRGELASKAWESGRLGMHWSP